MKKQFLLACSLLIGAGASSCVGSGDAHPLLTQQTVRQNQEIADGWSFRELGKEEWMRATVPGVVHTDLLDNSVIPHPYASVNEPELQWIGERTWEYRTTFTPADALLGQQVQELVFKGIDTYADVYLNGEPLLTGTDNMFVEWRVPVTGKLLAGQENELRVVFHPPYPIGEALAKAWPVKLPADNDKGAWKTSVFTRKAPYHFGWDWGPVT